MARGRALIFFIIRLINRELLGLHKRGSVQFYEINNVHQDASFPLEWL